MDSAPLVATADPSASSAISKPACDTANEMKRALLTRASPDLSRAIDEPDARHPELEDAELKPSELERTERALLAALEAYIRGSWESSGRLKHGW